MYMKLNNNLLNIKNTHSTSETDVYSANYVNGKIEGTILYSNSTGTTGNITLNDDINNYSKIDIYCSKGDDNNVCSFYKFTQAITLFVMSQWGETAFQMVTKRYIITSPTQLASSYGNYINIFDGDIAQATEQQLVVNKIIGYK